VRHEECILLLFNVHVYAVHIVWLCKLFGAVMTRRRRALHITRTYVGKYIGETKQEKIVDQNKPIQAGKNMTPFSSRRDQQVAREGTRRTTTHRSRVLPCPYSTVDPSRRDLHFLHDRRTKQAVLDRPSSIGCLGRTPRT
jgi:hypothetical protein